MITSINKIVLSVLMITVLPSCKKGDVHPDDVPCQNPFPNHTDYVGNHIKPSNYTQSELDDQTKAFYDEWKDTYLVNNCNENEYYIAAGSGIKTVSEAHGYGMMIVCYMAGHEKSAKTYFDGLYRYYKSHPSRINNRLMDWQQMSCNDTPGEDDDAASDGDIDIAFSLLLAHNQWGSTGEVNYLSEAKSMINSIMQDEINPNTQAVKLGDWCTSEEPEFYYGTRSSDFITDHFKVFATVSGDAHWNLVVDECFSLTATVGNTTTGLMPDFIIHTEASPVPAGENYLEDVYDGDYYYNACRFPWRIGTDYLTNGDDRAKTAVNKINTWLFSTTSGDVSKISNGYTLNGTPIYNWSDATFIGPYTVGAMADVTKQDWLNSLYNDLLNNNDIKNGDYYSNTLKLLSMIVISGNYWIPVVE